MPKKNTSHYSYLFYLFYFHHHFLSKPKLYKTSQHIITKECWGDGKYEYLGTTCNYHITYYIRSKLGDHNLDHHW